MEYLTVTDLRDEFGADIETLSDATLVKRLDRLAGELEDQLGHSFGRAIIVTSSAADTVTVTATGVTIGGDVYLFADYTTLDALVTAVNAAADTYQMELIPRINPFTPSTYLMPLAETVTGPTYDKRQVLRSSVFYYVTTGGQSHIFVPLPIKSITSITEDGVLLPSTSYYGKYLTTWVIRKGCHCVDSCNCTYPMGRWSSCNFGNIAVNYVPVYWGSIPSAVANAMMDSFSSISGLSVLEAESFGEYSYRRGTVGVESPVKIFGGSSVRQYAVRLSL